MHTYVVDVTQTREHTFFIEAPSYDEAEDAAEALADQITERDWDDIRTNVGKPRPVTAPTSGYPLWTGGEKGHWI